MNRANDLTLISLVVGMFIALLVCMSILGYSVLHANNNDYKYEILQEDYTRKIANMQRDSEVRVGRFQEQLNALQFTSGKRIELLEEQVRMYRNETRSPATTGR
jgi:hypothetical protein